MGYYRTASVARHPECPSTDLYDRPRAHICDRHRYDSRSPQKAGLSGWTGGAYATANSTGYVWDSWLLLAETDMAGAIRSYHVHGFDLSLSLQGAGEIGEPRCQVINGTNLFYSYDGNGSVTDVLRADGAVVAHYEYDPFGRTVAQSGSFATENKWRFSTKQFDDAWGLYYYGQRFYSASFGRWLSRDPIGEKGGAGLYVAVGNDGVNVVDYLGDSITHEQCSASWTAVIKSNQKIKELVKAFGKAKCKLPPIGCACCSGTEPAAPFLRS